MLVLKKYGLIDLVHNASHVHDAVTWWNRLGRLYGPLFPQVRSWLNVQALPNIIICQMDNIFSENYQIT